MRVLGRLSRSWARIALAAALLLLSSCVTASQPAAPCEIVVDAETVAVTGWISTRGEWMLYPGADFDSYDPYTPNHSNRCVSLVNDTGRLRDEFAGLDGRRVTATGFVVRYDDLPVGDTYRDRLLSRRYYRDEPVFNFCLRDFVFIAQSVEPM